MQKRNIGSELAARMTHLNEMLADGESVGAINRADVDSPQPVVSTPQTHATPGEGTSHGGCTLTTYERDVLRRVLEDKNRLAGDAIEPRGWVAMQADTDADVLRGLLERLG